MIHAVAVGTDIYHNKVYSIQESSTEERATELAVYDLIKSNDIISDSIIEVFTKPSSIYHFTLEKS